MRNSIVLFAFLFTSIFSFSQQKVTWDDLSKVTFTEKYYPKYDDNFLHPKFSESVKNLEGKVITITGYFLSLDPNAKIYILSKGPMSSCFFCGVGGPETAVELQFDTKQKYKTDTIVTVTGTLSLNDSDVEHFNYILSDCTVKIEE
ncbi:hypothetical protein [Tenacibaculum jejuense]|uniref:DUF3299 domain-containing protein n=1 Tax=Tenacibaculum jejuense TaxID=584609 RepID=A0A238U4E6_9FLAO|nr:hypothetical protein [Tenacibaculum jejuense]SNR13896.1 conserved exported protein of unknown function [Tenacibaculum jejuense]